MTQSGESDSLLDCPRCGQACNTGFGQVTGCAFCRENLRRSRAGIALLREPTSDFPTWNEDR